MHPRRVLFAVILNEEARTAAMAAATSSKARATTHEDANLFVDKPFNPRHGEPCSAALSALPAHTRRTHAAVTDEHAPYALGEFSLRRSTWTRQHYGLMPIASQKKSCPARAPMCG